jgi:hypothetical protein
LSHPQFSGQDLSLPYGRHKIGLYSKGLLQLTPQIYKNSNRREREKGSFERKIYIKGKKQKS